MSTRWTKSKENMAREQSDAAPLPQVRDLKMVEEARKQAVRDKEYDDQFRKGWYSEEQIRKAMEAEWRAWPGFFIRDEFIKGTIERIATLTQEHDEIDKSYDVLIDSLKTALGDAVLLSVVDPMVGFVPEDVVRGISSLKKQVQVLSAPVSNKEWDAWMNAELPLRFDDDEDPCFERMCADFIISDRSKAAEEASKS